MHYRGYTLKVLKADYENNLVTCRFYNAYASFTFTANLRSYETNKIFKVEVDKHLAAYQLVD